MEERLNKFLSRSGVCSRRKADEYIESGRVSVNGNIVRELGVKVKDTDVIAVDKNEVDKTEEKIYIKLNKPVGFVSTAKEQFGRPCVTDLVKSTVRLYPVGRLDMFSEGLIILTNDGDFVNKVIHPTQHVKKTYEVTLSTKISENDIESLKNGIDIGGYITKEAFVNKIKDNVIEIIISEGKNRQIRKMCEALGYKVVKLKRTKIGQLSLGSLKPGEYERLDERDIKKIFK